MNKRQVGTIYEEAAAAYLEQNGCTILERNFRCRQGEIDLIARDGEYLVFVEVKYRRDRKKGSPLEAVSRNKQRTISRVALYYLYHRELGGDTPCRFDVIGLEKPPGVQEEEMQVSWIKNAFDYQK